MHILTIKLRYISFLSSHQITPLHVAAEGGRVGTVESLLAKGADINIKDDKGVSGEAELDFFFFCWGGGVLSFLLGGSQCL